MLFGVMTEEIRWLQSGVVAPRVTPRSLRQRRHLRQWANLRQGRGANVGHVVLWTFTDISRLWAPA